MADDDAPPPAAAPEVLAGLELAQRRFELLERRIAAWERRVAAIEDALAEEAPAQAATADVLRFDDLEARVSRLERKRFEQLARGGGSTGGAGAGGAASNRPITGPIPDPGPARAMVHATWSPPEAAPGEAVTLGVTVDGFPPDETVAFTISELHRPDAEPVILTAPIGDGDRVSIDWTPPEPPKAAGRTREFAFVARCAGQEATAPVLVVRRP